MRGVANVEPVTAETALKLGRAAAHVITQNGRGQGRANPRPTIALGKDTRQSGYMLEDALAAGLMSLGVDVFQLGPLPTPGVAYITRSLRCDAGIALTASHNPYEDNGIKFFHYDGYKLDDSIERRIEDLVFSGEIENIRPTAGKIGRAQRIDDALGRYVEFAKVEHPAHASRWIRCASPSMPRTGPAYKSTPWILRELGADVLHLPQHARRHQHQPRLRQHLPGGNPTPRASDRRADRHHPRWRRRPRAALRREGRTGRWRRDHGHRRARVHPQGRLAQNTLVATVMSNYGLEESLGQVGGKVLRAQVGDRYVIEQMVKGDLNVGGEQSGHMIFRDYTTTGDGIITALQILRIMAETGKPLSELKQCLVKYPQAQRNLRVTQKPPLEGLTDVSRLVEETNQQLGGKGRVLLRYSGTEPKIRLLHRRPRPGVDRTSGRQDRRRPARKHRRPLTTFYLSRGG